MKPTLSILIFIFLLGCKGNENKQAENLNDTTVTKVADKEYTCPMHPEVISNKPGQCPNCGMDLEIKS